MTGLSPKYTQKIIKLFASKIFKDQRTIYYSGFPLLSWRTAVLTLQLSCHSGSYSNDIMELSWMCSRSKNLIHYSRITYPIPADKTINLNIPYSHVPKYQHVSLYNRRYHHEFLYLSNS